MDDLEMAFRECNVNLGEMQEYIRNVEPIKLTQPVHSFPMPAASVLIYPETCEEDVPQLQDPNTLQGKSGRGSNK